MRSAAAGQLPTVTVTPLDAVLVPGSRTGKRWSPERPVITQVQRFRGP
jgi:hypothetical protein